MDGDKARQIFLVRTTEKAQEIAQAGPHAFGGIGADFSNTITVHVKTGK